MHLRTEVLYIDIVYELTLIALMTEHGRNSPIQPEASDFSVSDFIHVVRCVMGPGFFTDDGMLGSILGEMVYLFKRE